MLPEIPSRVWQQYLASRLGSVYTGLRMTRVNAPITRQALCPRSATVPRMTESALGTGPMTSANRSLSRIERFSLALATACNRSHTTKRLLHALNVSVTYHLVKRVAGSRLHTLGLEHVTNLERTSGLMVAANHRSFFDLFLIMAAMAPVARAARRMYFPVRSGFWYDSLLGIGTNAAATCMSMYPPIFRAPEKREETRAGLDFLANELRDRDVVVGMHPEGTRSKCADPYALLPPERSFGRVALLAKPVVVPVFVNGVGNSLVHECISGLRGTAPPIVVAFGAPVDLSDFAGAEPARLRAQIEIGQRVLDAIRELGVTERKFRAALRAETSPRR